MPSLRMWRSPSRPRWSPARRGHVSRSYSGGCATLCRPWPQHEPQRTATCGGIRTYRRSPTIVRCLALAQLATRRASLRDTTSRHQPHHRQADRHSNRPFVQMDGLRGARSRAWAQYTRHGNRRPLHSRYRWNRLNEDSRRSRSIDDCEYAFNRSTAVRLQLYHAYSRCELVHDSRDRRQPAAYSANHLQARGQ